MKIIETFFICVIVALWTYPAISQDATRARVDSLIQKLSGAKEDTNKLNLYIRVLDEFTARDANEGLSYAQPALDLAGKLHWRVAKTHLLIGRVYWKAGNTTLALKHHFDALKIAKAENDQPLSTEATLAIGQDYADSGNYPEALKYFFRVREVYLKADNKHALGSLYLIMAWVYDKEGNFVEASKLNLDALKIYESGKEEYGAAVASANVGGDLMELGNYREAAPYLTRSSQIYIKNGDFINLSSNYSMLSEIYSQLHNYHEALKHADLAFDYGKKINDGLCMGDARSQRADVFMARGMYAEAVGDLRSAIAYYRTVNANHLLAERYCDLSICYTRLSLPENAKLALDSAQLLGKQIDSRLLFSYYLNGRQLYDSLMGSWKDAYLNYYRYISLRDSMFNAENTSKLLQQQMQYASAKKELASKAFQEKKDIRQRTIRNSILAGFAGALIFLVVVYRQRNKISRARKRSDELLLNILPAEVAEELKQNGSAEARQFAHVTVMFTDFKGFSQISEKLSPTELVRVINTCFKAFDEIIGKYNIEKIKTIGDSYMCAGGLPVESATHAEDVVRAALEIQQFMLGHFLQRKSAHEEVFETRIGIHSGPVVAGIVGIKKFAYDIWGDTVNIASRMESSGEPGKVNISQATYLLVKDKFNCVYRGKLAAKNKGAIDMYFIETA